MNFIRNHLIEVKIIVEGQALDVYHKDNRYWVAGTPGKHYSIVTTKIGGGGRIECIQSVDGSNVLDDEPASFKNGGMVFYHVWENHGWRINDSDVREFVFADPADSIAAQAAGSVANVGVIGIAAFTEKSFMPLRGDNYQIKGGSFSRASGLVNESAVRSFASADSVPDLGTSMGQLRRDEVGHTTFERSSSHPAVIVEIQYRTREWLVENGIVGPSLPSAWPDNDVTGYGRYVK